LQVGTRRWAKGAWITGPTKICQELYIPPSRDDARVHGLLVLSSF